MSLLLNALKDAEGRKRAQQTAAAPAPAAPPAPEPAADLGEVAALLSSTDEDTLLSLEEDVGPAPRNLAAEPVGVQAMDVEPTPGGTPLASPPAAFTPAASPTTFPGLPTPQDILRARAERAAPAQAAKGSTVASARAARGAPKTREGVGAAAAEAGLDALAKRLASHLPPQLREHPLPIAGGLVALLLLVGWLMFGSRPLAGAEAPLALGPSLPPTTVVATPAETAAGPQGPDDVAPPEVEAPVTLSAPAAVPAKPATSRSPREATTAGAAPHRAPGAYYGETRSKPRLEIAGRPSPLPAAYAALRAGDFALAERLYAETLAGEPDQPDAHLGLAVLAQSRNDDPLAVRHYRAVLETVPDHPRAWAGLAALAGNGELEPMESKLRSLIAARPAPPLHFALGNVLARQGRWAEAQQGFFAASAADPQNADYAFNLAIALDRLGKSAAAAPHYARAIALAEAGVPAQFQPAAARQRLAELQPGTP